MSQVIGLCLKGVAIGTIGAVCVTILAGVVMFLLPLAMAMTSGVAATGGGGISGVSVTWPTFVDSSYVVSGWLMLTPGAIGFIVGFFWMIRRSRRVGSSTLACRSASCSRACRQ